MQEQRRSSPNSHAPSNVKKAQRTKYSKPFVQAHRCSVCSAVVRLSFLGILLFSFAMTVQPARMSFCHSSHTSPEPQQPCHGKTRTPGTSTNRQGALPAHALRRTSESATYNLIEFFRSPSGATFHLQWCNPPRQQHARDVAVSAARCKVHDRRSGASHNSAATSPRIRTDRHIGTLVHSNLLRSTSWVSLCCL